MGHLSIVTLFTFFKRLIQQVIALIRMVLWPAYCAYCRIFLSKEEQGEPLCQQCLARIRPIVSTSLRISKKKELVVFAVSNYEAPLRTLIQAKQYEGHCVSKQLGTIIWHNSVIPAIHFDYIVPIPLHWTRYAKRGFNQAEEIAHSLSHFSGKPVIHLLKRIKKTAFQAGLSREERLCNIRNVFSVSIIKPEHKGKVILLVDDVMTTGATLQAATKALGILKPKRVIATVVCRVTNS